MPDHAAIETVAHALGDLKDRCLLTGGISIPFYLTEYAATGPDLLR